MELKVSVDGVQRIICGVTKKTTCQEVVIVLAQAMGRTGRYTLKEKFKEYERSVSPGERLLESLAKYGQQSRDVQLTLHHNGPPLGLEGLAPCIPLWKVNRGSCQRGANIVHRQSLPPQSCLRIHRDSPEVAEVKKPKHKSLILVEDVKGWLQSLGRSGRHQCVQEKVFSTEKTEEATTSKGHSLFPGKFLSSGVLQELGNCKQTQFTTQQQRSSFLYDHSGDGSRRALGFLVDQSDNLKGQQINTEEKARTAGGRAEPGGEAQLQAMLVQQQARLQELQAHIHSVDVQIHKLEERVSSNQSIHTWQHLEEEEDDGEQLEYWKNELRAEEGYEKDLQEQFLEMKRRAAECKAQLEEYRARLQGLGEDKCSPGGDLSSPVVCAPAGNCSSDDVTAIGTGVIRCRATHCGSNGPKELREMWARTAALHCTEVTVQLSSTRV